MGASESGGKCEQIATCSQEPAVLHVLTLHSFVSGRNFLFTSCVHLTRDGADEGRRRHWWEYGDQVRRIVGGCPAQMEGCGRRDSGNDGIKPQPTNTFRWPGLGCQKLADGHQVNWCVADGCIHRQDEWNPGLGAQAVDGIGQPAETDSPQELVRPDGDLRYAALGLSSRKCSALNSLPHSW